VKPRLTWNGLVEKSALAAIEVSTFGLELLSR
jgi:hypothetical protein